MIFGLGSRLDRAGSDRQRQREFLESFGRFKVGWKQSEAPESLDENEESYLYSNGFHLLGSALGNGAAIRNRSTGCRAVDLAGVLRWFFDQENRVKPQEIARNKLDTTEGGPKLTSMPAAAKNTTVERAFFEPLNGLASASPVAQLADFFRTQSR